MLTVNLNEIKGIAILEPEGELSENDFKYVTRIIDPYIEKVGKLNGIIILVQSFPGWDSFSSLLTHLQFVKEHHKRVSHVAFVTDSPIGGFAEYVGSHFVSAEVKNFGFDDLEKAVAWISNNND